jgi:hypothetical protein
MTSFKRLFSAAPEGTAALFFIDSLPPGSSPLRGYVHLALLDSRSSPNALPLGFAHLCRSLPSGSIPAGSIQIFSMLGFAVYSTSLC